MCLYDFRCSFNTSGSHIKTAFSAYGVISVACENRWQLFCHMHLIQTHQMTWRMINTDSLTIWPTCWSSSLHLGQIHDEWYMPITNI